MADSHQRKLLYFTTEYPHISHTFIRREILGLEERGYEIQRVALKEGESGIERIDQQEAEKTFHILKLSMFALLRYALGGVAEVKFKAFVGLVETVRLAKVSDRGFLRHLAYLVEALVLVAHACKSGAGHMHVHFGTNAATVAYLARRMGGPSYSVMVHGPVEFDQPYGQSLGKKLAAAKFVAAISNYCRSQIFRWLPVDDWHKVNIVPCSVGDEWFASASSQNGGSQELVCVGRLDEQKGHLILLEALAEARKAGSQNRLVIIGDGPFRELIENKIRELELQDMVQMKGWCTAAEIRTQLLAARAFVLASFAEGLPVSIMEAMALKRPVIASRITGIPELVRDGVDGFLFTPADVHALTEVLIKVGGLQAEQLQLMGEQAYEQVRARHHTDLAVAKLDSLLTTYIR